MYFVREITRTDKPWQLIELVKTLQVKFIREVPKNVAKTWDRVCGNCCLKNGDVDVEV